MPLVLLNAVEGKPIPIYGDGMQQRISLAQRRLAAAAFLNQAADAGHQFDHRIGLDHIVIRPGFEPAHAIHLF